MLVESSANVTKAVLAAYIIAFKYQGVDGDDIGLDIIEFIALKMKEHADSQVAELGYFVRANLLYFHLGQLTFPEIHERLARAALTAPLGHMRLKSVFDFSSHGARDQ